MKIILNLISIAFWRLGGWDKAKFNYRDNFLPPIFGLYFSCHYKSILLFVILSGTLQIIRLGYGIPDQNDKGSFLGRLLKKDWLARGTAYCLYGLFGFSPLFIYQHNLVGYLVYSSMMFLTGVVVTKIKIKEYWGGFFNLNELLTGLALSLVIYWR